MTDKKLEMKNYVYLKHKIMLQDGIPKIEHTELVMHIYIVILHKKQKFINLNNSLLIFSERSNQMLFYKRCIK